jgi:hypothetical protein
MNSTSINQGGGSRVCVYCLGQSGAKLSREHVISDAALAIAFGEKKESYTRLPQGKILEDSEATIKDVCLVCNSRLSPYDAAGARLVAELDEHFDLAGRRIRFSHNMLSWMIKTNLNNLRIMASTAKGEAYPVDRCFYTALLEQRMVPAGLYALYVVGWKGTNDFWTPTQNIPYCDYQLCETPQKILVCNLRVKAFDTFMMIPAGRDYLGISQRCASVCDQLRLHFSRNVQAVDVQRAVSDGFLEIANCVPLVRIIAAIRPVK